MENRLSTLRDLANRYKRFGLSVAWLKAEAEAGRIPSFRAGRKLLFDPEAVEQSLLRRARAGSATCLPVDTCVSPGHPCPPADMSAGE